MILPIGTFCIYTQIHYLFKQILKNIIIYLQVTTIIGIRYKYCHNNKLILLFNESMKV